MIPGMSRNVGRGARRMEIISALVLFLAGTHLCLLSALTGQAMACTGVPVARKSCPDCHHESGKTASKAEAPSLSPCCVRLAPSSSIQLDRSDTGATSVAVSVEPLEIIQTRPLGARLIADERPPTASTALDPFGGRAPPLF